LGGLGVAVNVGVGDERCNISRHSSALTIGSGNHYMPDWINLDLYAQDADVRADIFTMPFAPQSFVKIYGGHLLEHIEYNRIPQLMEEIYRVAEPGAEVVFVGPDIDRAVRTRQPPWLLDAIVRGPNELPGSGHEWTSNEYLVLQMLNGRLQLEFEPYPFEFTMRPHWPNPSDAPWQYCVRGVVRSI
jgi:predicted SAM-dependent methyltransferase